MLEPPHKIKIKVEIEIAGEPSELQKAQINEHVKLEMARAIGNKVVQGKLISPKVSKSGDKTIFHDDFYLIPETQIEDFIFWQTFYGGKNRL